MGLTPTFTLTTGQNDTNLNAGLRGGAQPFGWAFGIGNTNYDQQGTAVTTDSSGNVYVAVLAQANYDPGPGTVTSSGADCLAKYSPAGALIWLDSFNASYLGVGDGIHGLCIAPDGSVYAAGQFTYPTAFNPASSSQTNPAENGFPSAFVLKLGSSGGFDWVHTFGTASEEAGSEFRDGGFVRKRVYRGLFPRQGQLQSRGNLQSQFRRQRHLCELHLEAYQLGQLRIRRRPDPFRFDADRVGRRHCRGVGRQRLRRREFLRHGQLQSRRDP